MRVPDLARAEPWLLAAGAALLAVAAWAFEHRDMPYDLWSGDERHYADVARQLVRGEGLTTQVVYPLKLQWAGPVDHPILLVPPLWMLSLAVAFAIAGPGAAAVHATVLVYFTGLVVAVALLARRLAGPLAGAAAAAAVVISPELRLFAALGGTEISFAFWTTLAFLLLACGRHPMLVGVACACAYLTRYQGLLTLGVVAIAWLRRPLPWRDAAWCAAGFVLCVLPLFVHRALVVGDPFFTYSNAMLYYPNRPTGPAKHIYHYLVEPDLTRPPWMHPLDKAREMLPRLALHWPLASMNAVAVAGALLGAVRRDRLALGVLALAVANTAVLALTIANGRYLVPFLPALVAVGAAMLWRHGGRLRAPALALLLIAPFSPVPRSPPDTEMIRIGVEVRRRAAAAGGPAPSARFAAMRACVPPDAIVLAENATDVAWYADRIAIYMPARTADFWTLVDRYDVRFAELPGDHRHVDARFERRFAPDPDCEGLYRRREGPRSDGHRARGRVSVPSEHAAGSGPAAVPLRGTLAPSAGPETAPRLGLPGQRRRCSGVRGVFCMS